MIYSRIDERDWRTIQQLIRRDPSHLWLVMNEPERRDQANLTPADGADLAKQMRLAGAYIAVPGVIITTQGLDWLDDYLAAGGPVPAAWHVHLYYAETADGMDRRLETWGDWMVKRDMVRPTIISEFNAQGADVAGQMAMMSHMAKRLDEAAAARDRGLDDWLWAAYWFSLKYKANESDAGYTNLIDDRGNPTELASVFVEERAGVDVRRQGREIDELSRFYRDHAPADRCESARAMPVIPPTLQIPGVGYIRPSLRHLEIDLGQAGVDQHRLQLLVTQHLLEFQHGSAVAQEVDGERVSKPMWVRFLHIGPFAGSLDHLPQRIGRHAVAELAQEERLTRRQILATHQQIAPHALHGGGADEEDAHLVALAMVDRDLATFLVVVADVEIAELAGADASRNQHHHDGVVSGCGRSKTVDVAIVGRIVCLHGMAGHEESFDLVFGEGFRRLALVLRPVDLLE